MKDELCGFHYFNADSAKLLVKIKKEENIFSKKFTLLLVINLPRNNTERGTWY